MDQSFQLFPAKLNDRDNYSSYKHSLAILFNFAPQPEVVVEDSKGLGLVGTRDDILCFVGKEH